MQTLGEKLVATTAAIMYNLDAHYLDHMQFFSFTDKLGGADGTLEADVKTALSDDSSCGDRCGRTEGRAWLSDVNRPGPSSASGSSSLEPNVAVQHGPSNSRHLCQ